MLITENKAVLATTLSSASDTVVDFSLIDQGAMQVTYKDSTPTSKTCAAAGVTLLTNSFTITAHTMVTGLKVSGLTTTSALPAGLAGGTAYWVIKLDANTISLATSLADAIAGNAVVLSDVGVGTTTFAFTSLAGCIVKLQASNDLVKWCDLSGLTVSPAGSSNTSVMWDLVDKFYKSLRIDVACTSGQLDLTCTLFGKKYYP